MKKTFIAFILLSLSLNLFADIIPKFGYSTIRVEAEGYGEDALISFKYCAIPSEPCELIGENEYYTVEQIKGQRKKERNHVWITYASILPSAAAAAYLGTLAEASLYSLLAGPTSGAVIAVGGMMMGFIAGASAPIIFTKNQRIQNRALSLSTEDIIVDDDKEVLRYRNQLEIVLNKIEE